MRTKTLLLAAAMSAASLVTSMGQAVYSVNAVGYINLNVPPGFSLLANQLIQATPTLAALIPNPPPGTTIYKYVSGEGYRVITFDDLDLVWTSPNETLDLGGGFFVFNPASTFTITFVGEVAEGNLSTAIPAGFSMLSSKVPQAGSAAALGLTGTPGDTVYKFSNATGYDVYSFDDLDLVWTPSEPSFGVGEGFFFFNPNAARSWTRTFDVTP